MSMNQNNQSAPREAGEPTSKPFVMTPDYYFRDKSWKYEWLTKKEAPSMFPDDPEVWPIVVHVNGSSAAGAEICVINHEPDSDPDDTFSSDAFANAKLIAAAPDLLRLAQSMELFMAQSDIGKSKLGNAFLERVREVIAQAV